MPSPATEHRIGQKRAFGAWVVGPKTRTPYLTQKTASRSVTGGKKVTTLLRFTTEKERMERGRGEKKSFLRLRARKRQIEPRAGEQAGWAVLAAKDGHPPKKGSDENKRRGRYCARDTTSLRSKKRQKSRGKYGSFCLPTQSVFVPWAL